ncbi:MAG TPA: carboxypeptidase regulatory-like domain-containing protein [Bacteroidia bacterium]|nr:carboxypeptidase regulatory-like domain-containing protein [Bacteroidia bacterium]
MKKIYLFITAFVFLGFSLSAQNNGGGIKVGLVDKQHPKESIPFANVVVYNGKTQVAVGTTDMDGYVTIKPLNAGKYNVKAVYVGYQPQQINDVVVNNDKTSYVNIALSNEGGVNLQEVVVTEYAVPLIDPDTKSGGTIDRETFQNMAAKDVNSVISTQAGVILTDNGSSTQIQVRGARAGNTNIYVDGERAIGTTNIPQGAVEQMSVMLGGLPAQYGDVTGGAVSITTRGTQPKWFGGVELISSQLTDPYGYNFGGFSLGGPLVSKKDSSNNKQPIVGFFMAGQGVYQKDPRPWYDGIPQVKSSKLSQLEQNPIQYNAANNTYYTASSFLTQNDLTIAKARPNVANKQISLAPKIDFQITPNLKITLGGNIDYNNYRNFVQEYSLLNSQHNPQVIEQTYRGYVRLTQKFGAQSSTEQDKTQSVVKRAYFTFQAGYQKYKYVQQDQQFKNDFFGYGYVGKFTEYRAPVYGDVANNTQKIPKGGSHGQDTFIVHPNSYGLQGYQDTLIGFVPGTQNPLAANYTSNVIKDIGASNVSSYGQIQNAQGLVNGSIPTNVQGLYYNTGRTTGGYAVRDNTIFRVTSNFSADIKNHSIMVGVEYDQRNERGYDVNARSLYTVANQLANQHNQTMDTTGTYYATQAQYAAAINADNGKPFGAINSIETQGAPISSTAGVFVRDVYYKHDAQSVFSKNFYDQVMGIHNGQSTQYINISQYDPSQLNLKMFSPDELLNNGQQLVTSWGYDYTGNRLAGSGKVAFSDFLDKFHTDKFGDKNYDRLTGAFTPVYMAGYIQDKFDYKDIKFNVGVRVDRYDANQQVLKDPFLLHEAYSVSDLSSLTGYSGAVPSNVPKDAIVYISDASSKQITGFRSGTTWYDASGNVVSDPKVIAEKGASGAQALPYLKNPSDKSPYSNGAFTAYKPQINVMPRVAFSFPISDVANFFAHYDILTQRPPAQQSDGVNGAPYTSFNRTNPQDYYFLSSNQGAVVANGNLKPERTVDYELGFSQILNEKKNAALKLSAFYREMRNQMQITRVNQAYPLSYITYGNIDFGTVKGFSAEFQLRRSGGVQLSANYTLQFAEGSGSNANGGYNLVNSSQPNLRIITPLDYDQRHTITAQFDYRFGNGKDYRGIQTTIKKGSDKEKNIQWLRDIGINFVARLGSGTPYSQRTPATSDVEVGNNPTQFLAGSLNGSRFPWQFRIDMRIDKNIPLTWGGKEDGDKAKHTNLNIYLQVLNLFNTRNVINVHSYTGSPKDDGYLSSAFGINEINGKYAQSAAYGQGFTTLYNAKLADGTYYSMPRLIRIGLQFDF